MPTQFTCSKNHEMKAGSDPNSTAGKCSICLNTLLAGDDKNNKKEPSSCFDCNFSVCDRCCFLVEKQQQQKSEKAVVLEDPLSMCQRADYLLNTEVTNNKSVANTDEPLKLYHRALSIRLTLLGKNHEAVASTYRLLAQALKKQRHYLDSLSTYQCALQVYAIDDTTNDNTSSSRCSSSSAAKKTAKEIQQEMQQLMDTMVDAANYYMMQGLDLQARHIRNDALLQFECSYSLLAAIVAKVNEDNNSKNQGSHGKDTIMNDTSSSQLNVELADQSTKGDPTATTNPTALADDSVSSFPSELELSLSLCHVCRVLASIHVSASQYATALPFLQQAKRLLERVLGKEDQRTVAMASDVATLEALMKKLQAPRSPTKNRPNNQQHKGLQSSIKDEGDMDESCGQLLNWFERDDNADINNKDSNEPRAEDENSSKPLGISVHWIKWGLWKEIQEANLDPNSNVQAVIDEVILPKLSGESQTYLDIVDRKHTGPASVMVVHSNQCTVSDLINTLDDYCRTHEYNDKGVHVWLHYVCLPLPAQQKTPQKDVQALTANIGYVLAIMSPWFDPNVWKTPSCLWTIYVARQVSTCKLILALPPAQTAAVSDALLGDPSLLVAHLYKALDTIQITEILHDENENVDESDFTPAQKIFPRLHEIFRPWIRNILLSQVHEHCNTEEEEIQAIASNTTDDMEIHPSSKSTTIPTAYGQAALDVFKLQLCNKVGLLFWHYGEYKAALELLEDALTMSEAMNGETHDSTATVYQNIANVLSDMGRYEMALETYEKVLQIQQGRLPEFHPRLADICTKIGNLHRITRNLDTAMDYHQRALTMHGKLHGNHNNLSSADSYNDMANVFLDKGDRDAALKNYRKALKIQEAILDKSHPSLATTRNLIGMALKRRRDYDEALGEFNAALAIQKEVLGEDHVETAMTFENVASVMSSLDDLEGALEMYQKAKIVYEKVLGIYHPSTATVLQALGTIQNELDNVDDALQCFRAALEIRESVLGKEHLSVAETLRSLGILLFEIGDLDDALTELQKSYEIMESRLGSEHRTTKKLADTINEVLEA